MLGAFAERWGISFPLLSDEGSQVIRALGLLNDYVEEQVRFYGVAPRAEHQGIPYSGLFLLDENGVVVEKQFEQSYRHRPVTALVLDEMLGVNEPAPERPTLSDAPGLSVAAWLDAAVYRPYQKLRLHLALRIEPGMHLYAAPAPDGYTPLTVELAPAERLSVWPLIAPAPRPFRVAGLEESFLVYEGTCRVSLPFSIDLVAGDLALEARVSYQLCSATACYPPATVALSIPLVGEDLIRE